MTTSALLLFAPLAVPLFSGRVFAFNDLRSFHLPLRFLYQQALLAGDSFLWTPAMFSGFYLFGEGQVGMAHPFHYVLYRGLPLSLAFNIEILASYVFTCVGMRILLRHLSLSVEASWFGAMLFAFSGTTLLHLTHVNAIAVVAHMPWLLLSVHQLLTSKHKSERAKAFLATVALVASQMLLGHPQYVWMSSLAIVVVASSLAAADRRWQHMPLVASAIILGVGGAAIQLLPTLDVLESSVRSSVAPEFRSQFSLALWRDAVNALAPQLFPVASLNEQASYSGAFSTVAVAWLAIRWRGLRHRAFVAGCAGLAVVGGLLSLGTSGLLFDALTWLPVVGSFRIPGRYMLLVHFALSGLGAVAFDDLLGLVKRQSMVNDWRLWGLAVAPTVAVGAVLFVAFHRTPAYATTFAPDSVFGHGDKPWPFVLLLVITSVVVLLVARRRSWALLVLAPLVALDHGFWGYSHIYRGGGAAGSIRTIEDVRTTSVPSSIREGDRILPGGNTQLLRGVVLASGYVGLMPRLMLDRSDPLVQRLVGVRWVRSEGGWTQVSEPLPRIRLLSQAQVSTNPSADLQGLDIEDVALVDAPVGRLSGPPGQVRILQDRPGSIIVETETTGAQLLVVAERSHEGWKAMLDGHLTRPLRAYGELLASEVPSGRHQLSFTFSPRSFAVGVRVSLVAWLLTVVVTLALGWRGRSRTFVS